MKKALKGVLTAVSIWILGGWSSEVSMISREHKINVKGVLETQAHPKGLPVENIAIGGLTEGIRVYAIVRDSFDQTDKALKSDPEKGEKDYLDFVQDIAFIEVPNAADVWAYHDPKKLKSDNPPKYIVVEVGFKAGKSGRAGNVEKYLMNTARLITCRVVNDGVVREKDLPFTELIKLTITSAVLKDDAEKR